jgi:pimeloyl-ACP methyl ester carboxylesterase
MMPGADRAVAGRSEHLAWPLPGRRLEPGDLLIPRLDAGGLPAHTAVPNLRDLHLVLCAGHWIQQARPELTNAALVKFAVATS